MYLNVINPATGEQLLHLPAVPETALPAKVEAAESAFQHWRRQGYAQRAACLRRLADLLREEREAHAYLMVVEMGKTIASARAEIDKCAWACDYYAEHGAAFLADEHIATEAARSYIHYQPLGVLLAVMPWNFPFWQVFRFAAPALMAGNAALLKHASNVPGCALAIESLILRAGFPKGLFQSLLVGSGAVAGLIAHPLVRAVTLTGSTPAGQAVAAAAGRHLKKSVLELGGSDPYIVLADADLELAAATCAASRLINNGQSCIGAKRFIVEAAVYEDFAQKFIAHMAAARMGDPLQEDTQLGPLARTDLRAELHAQVIKSVEQGAHCLLGGSLPEGPGAYYPATVLGEVRPGMVAFDEELFGPVAALVRAADEAEALALANRSAFGLGAAIFTRDVAKGERLAAGALEAGCCFVNALVKSDPRLPFGGIKQSGYGRELSHLGIREFTNAKTVYVA